MTTSLLPSPLLATSVEAAAELLGDYDDLRCPICFGLMLAPRRLPRCSARHTFCGQCIAFWLQSQRDGGLTQCCPIDRRPLAADEHPEIDFELSRRVETLVVSCPNRSLGCAVSFALRDGAAHLASECRYRTVQCPSCQKPHTAAALARHMGRCFKHCDGCGLAVPRADLHHHEMALCLTKAHAPWWQPSQASAFKLFRDCMQVLTTAPISTGECLQALPRRRHQAVWLAARHSAIPRGGLGARMRIDPLVARRVQRHRRDGGAIGMLLRACRHRVRAERLEWPHL